jgi:hypothetical protein
MSCDSPMIDRASHSVDNFEYLTGHNRIVNGARWVEL